MEQHHADGELCPSNAILVAGLAALWLPVSILLTARSHFGSAGW